MNKFAEALLSGRRIVTAECLPPRGADAQAVKDLSSALPPSLDAVVVAENPDSIRSSAFSTAAIMAKERGGSVVLSMASRDRNRLGLTSDALGAAALNVEAILCMSGNHQSLDVCPEAGAANDVDSVQLAQALKKMVLYGSGVDGKELQPGLELQIGATAHPCMQPIELNLLRLRKKINVGADFLLTQAVFDMEGFKQWMEAVRETGLDNPTAIIPSVLPLTDVKKAEELKRSETYGPIQDEIVDRISNAADTAEEGVTIAAEMARQLKDMPGIRGIHILSGGREALTSDVIRQADL